MTSAFHCPCLSQASYRLPGIAFRDSRGSTLTILTSYLRQLIYLNMPLNYAIFILGRTSTHPEYRGANSCREMLQLTPNLEEFVVWPNYWDREPHEAQSPLQHSHLRRITIRGNPLYCLDKLLLPELREMFMIPTFGPWAGTPQLKSLLSQTSLEILSFSSDNCTPWDDDLIQILQACSSLVQLNLLGNTSEAMTKTFLARFALCRDSEDSNRAPLVPKLRTIKVTHYPSFFDVLAFADAIQSRMLLAEAGPARQETPVVKLETVEIHCRQRRFGYFDPETTRFRQLRDIGLKVNVPYIGDL